MPSIRRNVPVASPATQPTTLPPKPNVTEKTAPVGWQARGEGSSTRQTVASLGATVASLVPKLGPAPISPAPMLDALGDGNATIDVPLKPGEYTFKGVPFTVKPGTVAHVNVQVKGGQLVPVGNGQKERTRRANHELPQVRRIAAQRVGSGASSPHA